ncbi:MAG TPA: hypothetical protein VHI77_09665 [Solirubrobacterales bacterium]|jgi:hypothetical protein|nr:hypothetical protein [Solirubrobacterales bacterium]
MKSQRIPINARHKRRPHLPAAAHDAALTFEERVIWPSEDALRSAGGGVRRGVDGIRWNLQRRLLWPLQDGLRDPAVRRGAVALTAATLFVAALGVAGLLWASSRDSGGVGPTQVADIEPAPGPAPADAPKTKDSAATLHGATPVFAPPRGGNARVGSTRGSGTAAREAAASSETAATASSSSAATGTISSSPSASSSTSPQAAAVNGPPAGPQALAVAREFANAFVVYEIGETEAKVRGTFRLTATRELAHSLLRRPPKQPAAVKVPQAKVLNVVPAPSHDGVYPVSVSLLRVGVTSELRLEMQKTKRHGWQVGNLLG